MARPFSQVTGLASEAAAFSSTVQSNGFLGWSADPDKTIYTVVGVGTGSFNVKGAYADNTAYAVGDLVTYNNETFVAKQTVASNNTTKPAVGAVWRQASDKRGPAAITSASQQQVEFYR